MVCPPARIGTPFLLLVAAAVPPVGQGGETRSSEDVLSPEEALRQADRRLQSARYLTYFEEFSLLHASRGDDPESPEFVPRELFRSRAFPDNVATARQVIAQCLAADPRRASPTRVEYDIPGTGKEPTPEARVSDGTAEGYGGDRAACCRQAAAALRAGRLTEFAVRMLPRPEAARFAEDAEYRAGVLDSLSQRPDVVAAMATDFAAMATAQPKVEGQTATYDLAPDDATRRTVRLQRVDGHWRLPDVASDHRRSLRDRTLTAADRPRTVVLELVDGRWRLDDRDIW